MCIRDRDITEEVRMDLRWWIFVIRMTENGMPIPTAYGDRAAPPLAVEADSDAAGGSFVSPGRGVGAVCDGAWAVIKWPHLINSDETATCCNARWRFKLSFLELCGHMLHLCAFVDKNRGKSCVTRIDNSGTVRLWEKGYDLHCGTTDTLLRACAFVAEACDTNAFVRKIRRRSTVGAVAADALSKSDYLEFNQVYPHRERGARRVPWPFLEWLKNPQPTQTLGQEIVKDLLDNGEI